MHMARPLWGHIRAWAGGTARARATGHHQGTAGPVSNWVRPWRGGRCLFSLTVLKRSVVLWFREAMGR
jgi:hypothetical protein